MRSRRSSPPSRHDHGLYRREYEHDACGVAFVATLRGSAGHDIVDHALTALRNLDHRGATGADPLVGDGAGHPHPGPRRVPARGRRLRRCPPPGAYAVGIAFLPADERRARRDGRGDRGASPPRRASGPRLARRARRRRPRRRRSPATACRTSAQLFVASATGPAWSASALERLAFCLRKRAEREADVYFPSLSAAHHRLQGHAHHRPARAVLPGPVRPRASQPSSPSSTRASPPTRSRPGRSPTPTGSSRTTARSTPSRATATGCAPARASWPADVIPGDLERLFPICTPEALATRRPSTRCSSCCTSAAGRCRTRC